MGSLGAKRPRLVRLPTTTEPSSPERHTGMSLDVYLLRCSKTSRSNANKTSMLRSRHISTIPIPTTIMFSAEEIISFGAENIPNHRMVRRHLLPPRLQLGLGLGVCLQLADWSNSQAVKKYENLVESFGMYNDLWEPCHYFLSEFYNMCLRKMTTHVFFGCPMEKKKCGPSLQWMARAPIAWICSTPTLPLPKQLPDYSLSYREWNFNDETA